MQLASRFSNLVGIRSDVPLSEEKIRRYAPSIFADAAHESRSERYAYVPTIDVLNRLRGEGFEPFFVCQTRVRNEEKREHTKHMIRLRHATSRGEYWIPHSLNNEVSERGKAIDSAIADALKAAGLAHHGVQIALMHRAARCWGACNLASQREYADALDSLLVHCDVERQARAIAEKLTRATRAITGREAT